MTSKGRDNDVDMTSPRRIDVSTTSFQRCVAAGVVHLRLPIGYTSMLPTLLATKSNFRPFLFASLSKIGSTL